MVATQHAHLAIASVLVIVLLPLRSSPAQQALPADRGGVNAVAADQEDELAETELVILERNSRLANQALRRCRRYVDGWLAHADPQTGLIPRNLNRDVDIWNGKDSAADNYPFMVLTCALTDAGLYQGRMREMLETESRLTSRVGNLVDVYSFSRAGFQYDEPDIDRLLFDSSEYVKDGLMPLTEWLGPSPWSERMTAIVDDILAHAAHETSNGSIPSDSVEVNGEMMQVLGRLYWMTGDEKYLAMATRIAEYYLLGERHPTRDQRQLRLDDHSCELISGLSEVYVTCSFADPDRAKLYRAPIHEMLDRILEVGVNEHGLMYDTVDPVAGSVTRKALTDNWGYNYNAFYAVYLVDGTAHYRTAVRDVLQGLLEPEYLVYPWEGWGADGIADSVEGAINLYNREPIAGVESWIDANMLRMLSLQQEDGVIEGWHGDGNFARTAIMWALWKQQGITLHPWRADVRLGVVRCPDAAGHGVELLLSATDAWQGKLVFDTPRHETVLHLPLDYPRINQFPEWFTVEDETTYRVEVDGGDAVESTGSELRRGMPIELHAGQVLRVTVRTGSHGR